MTPRVRDFSLEEIDMLMGAAPRTSYEWKRRREFSTIVSEGKIVVPWQTARNFVWKKLLTRLSPRSNKQGFTLAEVALLARVAGRTPYIWVKKRGLKTIASSGEARVSCKAAKEFVLAFLIGKLPVSRQQQLQGLASRVSDPRPTYKPQTHEERKQVGSKQLVTHETAQRYLRMSQEQFQKFSFAHFDEQDFICGKGLWPVEFLRARKAEQLAKA